MDDPKLSLKDRIYLNPIEKYKYHGKFPWKLVIHILLLVFTSAQAVLILGSLTQYTRAQERIFYDKFVGEVDKNSLEFSRYAYIFTVEELKSSVTNSINNFYSIKDSSFEEVQYMNENPTVLMEASYLANFDNESAAYKHQYTLTKDYKGPFEFDNNKLKIYLQNTVSFKLLYNIKTLIPLEDINAFDCYNWDITQVYSFDKRAHFLLNLDIQRTTCVLDESFLSIISIFISKLLWIHIVVLVLAMASCILTLKYIYKMAKIYWKIKTKFKNLPARDSNKRQSNEEIILLPQNSQEAGENKPKNKWDMLKATDKGKLFNKWSIVCLIGNLTQIFGTLLNLINISYTTNSSELLIGFGCMLSFINIGRYLDYNKDYSTIYATISKALPNVLKYVLGVLPIFLGFIFFGLCLFWRSERFVSISSTMMTLFAVLNGDSVFDVFNDVAGVSFYLGQIYCYVFCIVFIV